MDLRVVIKVCQANVDLVNWTFDHICSAVLELFRSPVQPLTWLWTITQVPSADGSRNKTPSLYIAGMGADWPSTSYGPQTFEEYIRQHYNVTKPGISKLLEVNRKTGIDSRGLIAPFGQPLWEDKASPPSIEQTDAFFRKHATPLAVGACRKAIKEWGGQMTDITHTVAVTCTNAGSPGFDQEVVAQLGLRSDVDSTLLHGVGCAGGLAALHAAAQMARASGNQPANVLVFACEIPSSQVSIELENAERNPETSVGPVLFSDGSAALILCNGAALSSSRAAAIFDLLDWTTMRVPNTESLMAYRLTQFGFKLSLSREVPLKAASAIGPAFSRMLRTFSEHTGKRLKPQDFDWALHPGGLSVIKGVEAAMSLSEDHLRASYDVYRQHGNASSVAVLAVLGKLREMGHGRDNVIACSFGPGLMVEMAALQRSRS